MRFTGEEKGSLIREQSPVAIYSLTPGADAFTMRETRDGSLRKTVVWTLADGVWTMEVFDETVAPRELVRRDVRTTRPTARGVAHTLARGGEVVETETEEIDGIGPMPIRETRGVGAEARTTWKSYYKSGAEKGRVRSELSPDGSWTMYAYDPTGRVESVVSPFGDSSPVLDDNHAVIGYNGVVRRMTYNYGPVDGRDSGTLLADEPRAVVESVGSDAAGWTEVSRRYAAHFVENGLRFEVSERASAPGAAYGAVGNQRTVSTYLWNCRGAGRPVRRETPDGLVSLWSYDFTPSNVVVETTTVPAQLVGASVPACPLTVGIPHRTTIERTVEDLRGDVFREEAYVVTDLGRELLSWTDYERDAAGHELRRESSDGSLVERAWSCCGPEWEMDERGIVTVYSYDAIGRQATMTRSGVTTLWNYDLAGNATNVTRFADALVASSSSGYDSAGRLAWNVGEDGVRTEYAYSTSPEDGEVRTTIQAANTDCAVTNTVVSFRDGSTKASYLNGILKSTEVHELFASATYEGTNGLASARWTRSETDFLGRTISESRPGFGGSTIVTSNLYDTAGRLASTLSLSTRSTRSTRLNARLYLYDNLNDRVAAVDDRNFNSIIDWTGPDLVSSNLTHYVKLDGDWWRETRQWSIHEDNSAEARLLGFRRSRVTGLGRNALVATAPNAILASESVSVDQRGNATTNRLFRNRASAEEIAWTKYPTSTTPAVTVSTNSLVCSSTSQTGVTTTFEYDAFQREVSQTDGRGNTTRTMYDPLGRVTSTIDALGYATAYGYDALGRQVSVTDPLTNTVTTAYDPEGHVITQRGATYPVDYSYDEFGDKISMTTFRDINAAGDVTRWLRDEATGLVTNKVYADGNGPRYDYTPDGKLATRTWARGIVTTYSYDDNGSLTNTVYSDGTPTISLAYNRAGRQVRAEDAAGVTTFLYDDFGAVTTETVIGVAGTNTIIRHWDNYGRSLGYALNGVRQSTLGYDTVGRIVAVRQDNVDVVYAYADDGCEAGWMVSDVSGFSVSREVYRHPYRREHVMAITNRINGIVHSHYEFAYDDSGRLIRRNDDAFAYNGRSEIASAAIGADSYAYRYDSIGNNVWTALNLSTNVYAANAVNAYVSVGDGAVAREPTYDADGNMTFDGERTHVYDAENRLVSVSANGVTLQANFYDHQGRRVRKVTADAEHVFIYDGWNLAKEIVVSFGVTNTIEYLWGRDLSDSLQGAGGVGGLVAVKRNGALYVPLYDQNGNVTDYVGSSGSVVAHYEYDAFGNTINQSGTMADVFAHRFSTKYYDAETGLYYYGYRFYSPRLMRWINRDPVAESGGVNVYEFCQNRSTVLFDPKGLTTVRIKVGTEEKDSPRGFLNFIKIDAIVIEPPKEPGKLNFVQLKKSANSDWELDIQGTPGPYYYKLFDVWKNTRKNEDGRDVVTLYDAPGGFSDKVDFYTAVVEVNRTCRAGKHQIGFPIINCYDRVKVVASVSWSFDPYTSGGYQYSGKTDGFIKRGAMIPTLQQLINKTTWSTELCSTTKVEVQNER